VAGLAEKARDRWLDAWDYAPSNQHAAMLEVKQGFAFSQSFCNIEHAGGRVTKTRRDSMD